MKRRLLAGLTMVAATACNAELEEDARVLDASTQTDESDLSRGAIEGREFNAIEIDSMRPAFEKETVIKLNTIVRRSLETANEYTAGIRDIRVMVTAAAQDDASDKQVAQALTGLKQLEDWHAQALSAQTDMNAAVAALETSGEDYSEEILAGMVQYVNDVERLLREEIETLEKTF
ncbi:hypothetical protein PUV54_05750 [Hyphococcus flavus]|uniref:Uncharacterized protein n=1 Tax=Hyphococcus flavus TaxID=1866326 RepID=A0AAF0CGP7_9PROT|nr:hypothetical protein [Hyphococcus flavus]WDI32699.1 hypothetical protein PUV54_05750 [Hyphococcus flavus]